MPTISLGLSRGATYSTFSQLCFKSHVIGGEPTAINRSQNANYVTVTEKFLMKIPNNTLSEPGIESRTSSHQSRLQPLDQRGSS